MEKRNGGFYTLKGYSLLSDGKITAAMEDYLEMIARRQRDYGGVRAVDISAQLHVRASSVSKMIQQLVRAGLVNAEKYGHITLTPDGKALGDYLLHRHEVLHRFFCLLNGSSDELEQVEKTEHFFDERTVGNLEALIKQLLDERTKR